MYVTGKLLLLAVSAIPADGPVGFTLADIPPIDRRAADFYGAIAAGRENVTATWDVNPESVPVNSDITLTLTVRHAANPEELARPDLGRMSGSLGDFQIEPLPDVPPDDGVVRLRYRLRPRTAEPGTLTVPSLTYRYYRPRFPEGRRFQTTYAEPVSVTVTSPVAEPSRVMLPVGGPASFFAVVPSGSAVHVPRLVWVVPVLALPALAICGVVLGRRLFPDAARRAHIRRNRAVRSALDRLGRANRTANTAGEVAAAIRTYLVARHQLPPTARTPTEITAALTRLGWPIGHVNQAESLLRDCDSARFSKTEVNGISLVTAAADRIAEWEGHAS